MLRCARLTLIVGAASPTEVKLDIGGAEPEAGARALIVRARPSTVSAYHACDHLWYIAEQIAAFDAGYSLHLRLHAHSGFDAVTYALPADRAARE